ncbi:MAG: MAGa7180 family putative nuclease [Metamycoplasmataceae bacterium]
MASISKRHFYNNKEYTINWEEQIIILNEEFHKKLLNSQLWNKFGFKKIGGSSIGDVLLTDNFKSEFAAFANISWLGLPILDRKYVDAGIAIEPLVINVLREKLKTEIETFDPVKYNFDYFKEKDEIVGGIPDGFLKDRNIILEIKTTGLKNYDNWNSFGIPLSYLKQAQLYSYLMGSQEFWIVATFLKDEDYENPENFPIENRIVKNYKFQINKEQVEDDIFKIKSWYKKWTTLGYSPKFDLKKDGDLIEYLKCENKDEYKKLLEKWSNDGKLTLTYENI